MIEIYKSSVQNVRELKSSRKKFKRLINQSIKDKKKDVLSILTKNYALLYSSFAETCFLKMIHTPYGFSEDKIQQISRQRNLEEKWNKCLELALREIDNGNGEFRNKTQTLTRLIQKYIIEPSQIRNKIAHGQWVVAFNSENTSINTNTTSKINSLDFVKIDILFDAYEKIGQVVEDLIESPRKAHFRDFYVHLTELELLVDKTNDWSIKSKIAVLTKKYEKQKNARP
ncbi:hypothetical protein [Marinifilum sp. D714]|uniref:hypothetical protein n=1 Tax=Marinifilum sp. D714 TaxID=2937523 RepID=UPI0027C6E9C0|nr:hypothetical protein [Marinifilum sp. D714]MDQ2178003.1 hypothetical protein [Marinifilum sp. D714]